MCGGKFGKNLAEIEKRKNIFNKRNGDKFDNI